MMESLVKFLRANAQNIHEGLADEKKHHFISSTADMLSAIADSFERKGQDAWPTLAALVQLNERMRDAPYDPEVSKG